MVACTCPHSPGHAWRRATRGVQTPYRSRRRWPARARSRASLLGTERGTQGGLPWFRPPDVHFANPVEGRRGGGGGGNGGPTKGVDPSTRACREFHAKLLLNLSNKHHRHEASAAIPPSAKRLRDANLDPQRGWPSAPQSVQRVRAPFVPVRLRETVPRERPPVPAGGHVRWSGGGAVLLIGFAGGSSCG